MAVTAKRLMPVSSFVGIADDYEDVVSADGPFAWWRLTETSGTEAADFNGNHDGTLFGDPDLNVSGPDGLGSAVEFDGTTDRVDVGTLGNFGSGLASGFSVEFWVKWTATGTMRFGTAESGGMTLTIDFNMNLAGTGTDNGRIRLFFRDSSGSFHRRVTQRDDLNDGEWHHIVILWDGSTDPVDAIRIFVDGLPGAGNAGGTGTPSNMVNFANDFTWGAVTANGSPSSHFTGSLDEPALYDSVLTVEQINTHYATGSEQRELQFNEETLGDADGIDVGDIDGDGKKDVITASGENGTVEWWKQTNLYDWTKHTIDTGLTEVEGIVVGDFDDDGVLEVVALDQGAGTVRFYKHGGDPTGAWTGVTLASSRPNVQDAQALDIDGDGIPEIVYTFEGSGSGSGGIRWLDFDGTDPTDSADWTEYTMATHEGAWWLASSGPADIAGNGRDDIVFSSRTSANPNAVPGIYYLEKPADPTGAWTVQTIDATSADWLHVDLGDFSGDGNGKDVVAYDHTGTQGLKYYRFASAWASTALPQTGASNDDYWNMRAVSYSGSTRTAVVHIGEIRIILVFWDGSAWDVLELFQDIGYNHPMDDRIIPVDLGGDGIDRLVIADSGGNRWIWLTAP